MMRWCLVLLLATLQAPRPSTRDPWFSQTVKWAFGKEGSPWERIGALPGAGTKEYRVALQPLWALEGGVVAFEIVVTTPDEPYENLLGERQMDIPQAFVLELADLKSGIESSKFGATRTLKLPLPARGLLRVAVQDWRPGKGVGDCDDCTNIQGLTVKVEIEGK